jgi:hypothetical protein
MPKHTPGPWIQGKDHQSIISRHPEAGELTESERTYYGGKVICETVSGANATLIKAAPELLEACESMLESFELLMGPESPFPQFAKGAIRGAFVTADTKARKAIAKAKGDPDA